MKVNTFTHTHTHTENITCRATGRVAPERHAIVREPLTSGPIGFGET